MLDRRTRWHRITLGADKLFDVEAFVGDLRARQVTPHIAINGAVSKTGKVRKTALDGCTTRHAGYAISLRAHKRFERMFGRLKDFLRIATRYDRSATNDLAAVCLAATVSYWT